MSHRVWSLGVIAALYVGLAACGGGDDAAAPAGTVDHPCYPNGTCNAGLTCLSDYCVVVSNDGGTQDATSGDALPPDSGHADAQVGVDSGPTIGVDAGADAADTDATSTCLGDLGYSTADCQSCMDFYCCDQGLICVSDSNCTGLITCLQQCASNDTGCDDDCSSEYSSAVDEYNDLGDCLTTDCATLCGQ